MYKVKKLLFRCSNLECKKAISIYNNSFFANQRLDCNDIIFIGYLWLCKVNYMSIANMTSYSSTTIVKYIKIFRELVNNSLVEEDFLLSRNRVIVEIDESLFKDFWVVGIVERTKEKKCYFEVVKDRNTSTLRRIIEAHVKSKSIVFTDCWKAYQLQGLDIIHRKVNHSRAQGETFGIHTNTIEGCWNGLKVIISERNRNKESIKEYILEFCWHRKYRDNLWSAFLEALKK